MWALGIAKYQRNSGGRNALNCRYIDAFSVDNHFTSDDRVLLQHIDFFYRSEASRSLLGRQLDSLGLQPYELSCVCVCVWGGGGGSGGGGGI